MPPKQYQHPPSLIISPGMRYTATIKTNHGDIIIELFPSEAPRAVNNFVFLAKDDYYQDGCFHRVIKDFMIQGGCPKGDGTGGPGYRFPDEEVKRSYVKGTLAMANAGPNTNGSQFFIVHGARVNLPPNYTIFGQMLAGRGSPRRPGQYPGQCRFRRRKLAPTERLEIRNIEITEQPLPAGSS